MIYFLKKITLSSHWKKSTGGTRKARGKLGVCYGNSDEQ